MPVFVHLTSDPERHPPMPRFRSAALLLLLSACSPDDPAGPQVEGRMTGTLDGTAWKGTASASIYKGTLFVGSTRDRAEQHVALEVPFTGPGRYTVPRGKGRYAETVGRDVLTYHAEATAGTLEVATYDPVSGAVTGTFVLTAEGSRGVTRFEHGQFTARVVSNTP